MSKTITKQQIQTSLPKRFSFQNKGDFGHVLAIGGSFGMAGSVCLAANGALRTGAGLVTAAVPDSIAEIVSVKLTECMVLPILAENGRFSPSGVDKIIEFSEKCNTIAFGMGAGKCRGTYHILEKLLYTYKGTLVIDADGLNILAENETLLKVDRTCNLILTPHPGEMSRLCHVPVNAIQSSREEVANAFAKKYNLNVVLKGEKTVITDGVHTYINPTGNVGMATGGAGDVLAGVIAGFSSQGLQNINACCCGCFVHGLAGDVAVKNKTSYCLTAGDLIDFLPNAFQEIINYSS